MTVLPSLSLLNKINQFIKTQRGENFSLNHGIFLLGWKSGLRVSEAVSFNYHLKHPRHKNLYLVKGKGNKKHYVYVSSQVISELKSNHWKPNQTNRFAFNNFLKKVKAKMNISANVELTPHTLRRCFTTHNALNGVPMPVLQKFLGHANIRTTSGYWKGSVDIRNFAEWLESDSVPKEPAEVPEVKVDDTNPKVSKIPVKSEKPSPNNSKEPEYLKTIEKLKTELEQKDLTIVAKDKHLRNKDIKISLLIAENRKLKAVSQGKDKKLQELQEKIKQLTVKNKSLIENSANLKSAVKNLEKIKEKQRLEVIPKNNNFLLTNSPNTLLKIDEPESKSLTAKKKPEAELLAQVQVWKPPS